MSRRATRHFDSQRLRDARAEVSLTAEKLAREIDVTMRTVQRWESGEGSGPSGADLIRLSIVVKRDPDWFYPEIEREAA